MQHATYHFQATYFFITKGRIYKKLCAAKLSKLIKYMVLYSILYISFYFIKLNLIDIRHYMI